MALTSITKDFVVRSGLIVQGTTNPVTTTTNNTNVLQVNGAAAFAKDIMVANTATIWGPAILKSTLDVSGNVTVGADKFVITAASGDTYIDGNVGIRGSLNSTGTFSVNDTVFTVDGTTGDTYIDGNALINGDAGVQGTFNSTGSFSVNIDKFTVDAANGNTHVQGDLDVTGTTYLSTVNVSGGLTITDPTNGGSGSTGALVLSAGGAYINQDLYIAGTTAGGASAGALVVAAGGAYVSGDTYIGSATGSSTGGGALVVSNGGAYIYEKLQIDGTEGGASGLGTLYMPNGGFYAGKYSEITSPNLATDNYPALSLSAGGLYVNQDVKVDSTITAADSAGGTAALRVAGGVYIGDNLIVKSTAADTGTNTANALYVAGGAWIDKTLVVEGEATFNGNVAFNGTATYVYSTNTVYTDNIINMHTPNGGDMNNHAWGIDDGKDIGLVFHYYKGSDKNGFLGFANDSSYLEWYSDGTENIDGTFTGTVYGTFKTGSIELTDTTAATNTGTGALRVAGGVGIAGDVYIGGKLDVSEITSGADIKATVTTATNLKGGLLGEIPIQNADGSTSFIAAGTGFAQVLTWNTLTSTATWESASATTVGRATTATNIDGGAQYDIPFQSAYGLTTFDTGVFQYNDSAKTLKVDHVTFWGTSTNTPGDAQVEIVADGGLGIELFSDSYAQLNYDNTGFIYVNSSGATLEVGSNSFTLDTSGNATLNGSGYLEAPYVRADNLTSGRVVLSDSDHQLVDDANLTFDGTNLTIGGSGGDITMTNGNITGVAQVQATAVTASEITATSNLYLTDLAQGSALFIGANGQVSEDANFTWSVAGSQLSALNITGATLTATTDLFLTALTQNSVPYIGADGQVSEDNTNFTWDATGTQLHAANITGSVLTATSNLYVTGSDNDPFNGTAALQVTTGGAYVEGKVYINDTGNNTLADYLGAGALAVYGGVAINNNLAIASTEPTLAGTNTATSFGTLGGAYIEKDLYVGTTATIGGDLYVDGQIYMQGVGLNTISASTGTFDFVVIEGTGTGLTVVDGAAIQGVTQSTSTTSGALVVNGGVGVGKDLHVGQDLWVTGTAHIANIAINDVTLTTLTVNSTATLNGPVFINTTTQADGHGSDTGAVQLAGGLLVKKNIVAGGLVIAGDYSGSDGYLVPEDVTVDAFYAVNNMQAAYTKTGITGSSNVNLDKFDSTLYTTAKYLIQVKDGSSIHSTEILLIQDGTDAYITEYAILTNTGELGVFDAVVSGGFVTLKFVPTGATAMTIQVVRQSILTTIENYC